MISVTHTYIMCVISLSHRLLQVKTGRLVFYEYEVYVTESLFKTAKDFSRQASLSLTVVSS